MIIYGTLMKVTLLGYLLDGQALFIKPERYIPGILFLRLFRLLSLCFPGRFSLEFLRYKSRSLIDCRLAGT